MRRANKAMIEYAEAYNARARAQAQAWKRRKPNCGLFCRVKDSRIAAKLNKRACPE